MRPPQLGDKMKKPSYEQRQQFVVQLLDDPNTSVKEALRIIYHYTMFEYYLMRRNRLRRKMNQHGKFLFEITEVLNLRSEMSDL